jgi:D-alanyl-D-alanine carboxypeptidase/D-alanyl-D-alanine-endopeptidase (penicillin-binding protein 4)
MKSLIMILAIAFTIPVMAKTPANLESLKTNIEKVLAAAGSNVNVGIEVVSLKTNEVLYEKNSRNLFVPASLAKIFTVAAALDRLGPEFEFETKVAKDSKGNLYLIGAGDPSLKEKALDELAYRVFLQELKEFEDLVVDQTLFDNIVNGPGWMWDEGEYYWNSPIDALLVDHSCIDLWVLPAKTAKTAPFVLFQASEEPVKIENIAMTTVEKGEIDVRKLPANRDHAIEVFGNLALTESPKYFRVPVQSPHLYAARLFQKKLKSLGIHCKGSVHIGKTPAEASVIAAYNSLPLSVTMRIAMKDSDNLTSNCLFKKLGQHMSGSQGTWANGSKAVRAFLEERVKVLKPEDLVLLDGDGVSRYNLASPHHPMPSIHLKSIFLRA